MQTQKKLKTILRLEQPQLKINKEISDKIKFLCRGIAKVEWSGILFYKVEGNIRDAANYKIEPVDILLMDKGRATYTEYSFNEEVSTFIMDKAMEDPNWMSIKLGHIHSHNTMGVFFSGTDWQELYDNCEHHNNYLSLIVNNYHDMVAKIVYRGVPATYTVLDGDGETYQLPFVDEQSENILFEHDCEIVGLKQHIRVDDNFRARFDHILRQEKEKEEKAEKERLAKAEAAKQNAVVKQLPAGVQAGWAANSNPSTVGNTNPFDPNMNLVTRDEAFAAFVMRLGKEVKDDDLVSALDDLSIKPQDGEALSSHILNNYTNWYEEFYKENKELSTDTFLEGVEVFIEHLMEYERVPEYMDFVPTLIAAMEHYIINLKQAFAEQMA